MHAFRRGPFPHRKGLGWSDQPSFACATRPSLKTCQMCTHHRQARISRRGIPCGKSVQGTRRTWLQSHQTHLRPLTCNAPPATGPDCRPAFDLRTAESRRALMEKSPSTTARSDETSSVPAERCCLARKARPSPAPFCGALAPQKGEGTRRVTAICDIIIIGTHNNAGRAFPIAARSR